MPHAILVEKIAGISPKYQDELLAFVDFLLFKQAGDSRRGTVEPSVSGEDGAVPRKLGGYEQGYSMAADFDDPLEVFAEYM